MKQKQMSHWAAPIGPLATDKEVRNRNASEVLGEHLERQFELGTCLGYGPEPGCGYQDRLTKLSGVHFLICLIE